MNALEKNDFTESWRTAASDLKSLHAILIVSAHWLTPGTQVTAMERPQTIHDFGGFPKELFAVQYPAPGSPELAEKIIAHLDGKATVRKNFNWGLDHGAWSILVHMFPDANVPVVQLSIDADATPEHYFALGRALRPLRDEGILIVGSGNIVHNLRLVDWARLGERDYATDWAREAMEISGKLLRDKDWQSLIAYQKLPQSMQLAINSAEHYFPLLYILGAGYDDEPLRLFNDVAVGGALSMTSLQIG
jgi:4,5-DOPA dioxygenase extradiol